MTSIYLFGDTIQPITHTVFQSELQNTPCEAQSPPSRNPQLTTLPHKCNKIHTGYVRGSAQDSNGLGGDTKAFWGIKFEVGFEG